ncbi:MAG: YihA family ribosome biogenesis GTP-binding protein [Clostridia bacterium]|nr:YihA family ribosome biogenesis GTP-binding protein [Clostridia bacterium]
MNFNNAYFEKAFGTFSQLEESKLPEFCFSGRSNVGKSSLINKLVNRKSLARVGGKPGKTVTVNFYNVDGVYIVDLPGFGYAKVSASERERWEDLMEGYFKSGRNIKMVFCLVDMRHPATDFDISMMDFLKIMGIPYCVVLTKSDKLNKTEYSTRLSLIKEELSSYGEGVDIIPFSAQTGEGVQKLRTIIETLR